MYIKFGNDSKLQRQLIIDNKNQQPSTVYLTNSSDTGNDTGKTWLIVGNTDSILLERISLKGRAHLAFSTAKAVSLNIFTNLLDGDFTGQIHVSSGVNLTVHKSSPLFPASFRVYENGNIGLPETITLDSYANEDVSIEGTITGIKDLVVSSGVSVLLGDKVYSLLCLCLSKFV